jgi:23S rRNA (cytidine1920-2'-O)/16S rRNA (cytidine1409-2'-O)-methyltransferase
VLVAGEKVLDPKRPVAEGSEVRFRRDSYVGRGGRKLEHALTSWPIPVQGRIFLDAGASTGGFTDCLLQHGASLVHAVDVGYNQLAYKLRRDNRVAVRERTNIMSISGLDPRPQAAVADLSFRSLLGAAAHILSLTSDSTLIALLKPQFEYRPEDAAGACEPTGEFTGVLDDASVIERILQRVLSGLEGEGLRVEDIIASPIPGQEGNREFLVLLRGGEEAAGQVQGSRREVVQGGRASGDSTLGKQIHAAVEKEFGSER